MAARPRARGVGRRGRLRLSGWDTPVRTAALAQNGRTAAVASAARQHLTAGVTEWVGL